MRKSCFFRSLLIVTVAVGIVLASTPSRAITSKDVTEKMSDGERFSYLSGLVDMLSYQSLLGGDRTRAACVSDAFYKDAAGMKHLLDALYRFSDKAPEGIVIAVMKQACGS